MWSANRQFQAWRCANLSGPYKRIEPGSPCEPDSEYTIEKRWDFIKQNLKLETNNKMRILDVGCGYGIYIEKCSAYASEVVGIDIFKEHLSIAKRRRKDNTYLILNTAEHLAFKDNSFDAIICIETLEHISSDEETIKEFSRILKPGEMLIITSPNKLIPFETHVEGLGGERIGVGFIGLLRRFRFIPARLRRIVHGARDYTPWELKKLLIRNGFKVKQLDFLMPAFDFGLSRKDTQDEHFFWQFSKVFNFFEHIPLLKMFGLTIIVCCEKEKMKTKGFLICFTGIDGTGKTTLSKALVESLNKKGVKCKYVYAREKPFILKPFMLVGNSVFLRGMGISKNYSEYSNTKRKAVEKHSFLSRVYQQILLFDYILQIFFKVKLPLMVGKNIVCDRYVYDTVINDIPRSDDSIGNIRRLLKKCFRIAPKPDIAFLIDLPEEIAYQRKNDTPSIGYLKERRKVYLEVGKEYGMIILDGSKSLEELKNSIQKEVFEKVKIK